MHLWQPNSRGLTWGRGSVMTTSQMTSLVMWDLVLILGFQLWLLSQNVKICCAGFFGYTCSFELLNFFNFMYMSIFCMFVHVCATCVPNAEGADLAIGLPGTGDIEACDHHMSACNWTQVLRNNRQCALNLLGQLSGSLAVLLKIVVYLFKTPFPPPILRLKPSALWILGKQFTTEPHWQRLFFIERVWVWRVEMRGQLSEVGLLPHVRDGECCYQLSRLVHFKFSVASVWTSVCMHYCVHMPCYLWKPACGKSPLSACTIGVTDTELW